MSFLTFTSPLKCLAKGHPHESKIDPVKLKHGPSGLNPLLIISVYLSSLQVAHLSDTPRRRLVVTGDSARIQDETTENSAWFFNVLGV